MVNILVLEDQTNYANWLEHTLKQPEFNCHVAYSFQEASDILYKHKFDFAIIDLNLGDTEGLDTVYNFKRIARDTPFIVLSAVDDDHMAHESIVAGAYDYLVKEKVNGKAIRRAILRAILRERQHKLPEDLMEDFKKVKEVYQTQTKVMEELNDNISKFRELNGT